MFVWSITTVPLIITQYVAINTLSTAAAILSHAIHIWNSDGQSASLNFKNRLRFEKVIAKSLVASFFWDTIAPLQRAQNATARLWDCRGVATYGQLWRSYTGCPSFTESSSSWHWSCSQSTHAAAQTTSPILCRWSSMDSSPLGVQQRLHCSMDKNETWR